MLSLYSFFSSASSKDYCGQNCPVILTYKNEEGTALFQILKDKRYILSVGPFDLKGSPYNSEMESKVRLKDKIVNIKPKGSDITIDDSPSENLFLYLSEKDKTWIIQASDIVTLIGLTLIPIEPPRFNLKISSEDLISVIFRCRCCSQRALIAQESLAKSLPRVLVEIVIGYLIPREGLWEKFPKI